LAWVESDSPSFHCRHSSENSADVARLLRTLEDLRERLSEWFPHQVDGLTLILHDSPMSLAASNPMWAALWAVTDPGARRFVTGWVNRRELHVLAPRYLREAAAGSTGAVQMLAHAALTLYTRRVVIESNHDLHFSSPPMRSLASLRWAWMLEGASRWFSGETAYAGTAIGRRLSADRRPSFPPSLRDAPLLGGTVFDLLVSEQGEQAAALMSGRLLPGGSRETLIRAFDGRSVIDIEGMWRSHLAKLASASDVIG
jgi:hypothetical protein